MSTVYDHEAFYDDGFIEYDPTYDDPQADEDEVSY